MIFISLASYRDPELLQTIKSAHDNADNPDALVFGVYSQVAEGEHPDLSGYNVREVVVPYQEAQGAGYARSQVQKLYQDEEWYLQVDAHTLFEPHWDTRLIDWHEQLPTPYGIISGWAAPYSYQNNEIVYTHEDGAWVWEPHTTVARSYRSTWIGGRVSMTSPYAMMHVLLAGFIFAPGKFVEDVPYDPRIPFWGEEFMLSVRAYSAGYEFYSINEIILRHNYQRHGTIRAWDDLPDWEVWTQESLKVQRDILCLRDKTEYGIKNVDIPFYFEYMEMIGKKDLPYRAERIWRNSLRSSVASAKSR